MTHASSRAWPIQYRDRTIYTAIVYTNIVWPSESTELDSLCTLHCRQCRQHGVYV